MSLSSNSYEPTLAEALDEALWVKAEPNLQLVWAWFGGTMVHIYTFNGVEVDVFSFMEKPALEEVQETIRERIEEMYEEDKAEK
jgi:hypothetical protein